MSLYFKFYKDGEPCIGVMGTESANQGKFGMSTVMSFTVASHYADCMRAQGDPKAKHQLDQLVAAIDYIPHKDPDLTEVLRIFRPSLK